MKRRWLVVMLTLVLMVGAMIVPAGAAATPTTIGAPEHFGVAPYNGEYLYFTLSAPDDMRMYIEDGTMPNYTKAQLDFKMDDGDWHYETG